MVRPSGLTIFFFKSTDLFYLLFILKALMRFYLFKEQSSACLSFRNDSWLKMGAVT